MSQHNAFLEVHMETNDRVFIVSLKGHNLNELVDTQENQVLSYHPGILTNMISFWPGEGKRRMELYDVEPNYFSVINDLDMKMHGIIFVTDGSDPEYDRLKIQFLHCKLPKGMPLLVMASGPRFGDRSEIEIMEDLLLPGLLERSWHLKVSPDFAEGLVGGLTMMSCMVEPYRRVIRKIVRQIDRRW